MTSPSQSVVRREASWFACCFILPFVALIVAELRFSSSPLSAKQRICTPEDICAYGMCLAIPALVYIVSRSGYALWPTSPRA